MSKVDYHLESTFKVLNFLNYLILISNCYKMLYHYITIELLNVTLHGKRETAQYDQMSIKRIKCQEVASAAQLIVVIRFCALFA